MSIIFRIWSMTIIVNVHLVTLEDTVRLTVMTAPQTLALMVACAWYGRNLNLSSYFVHFSLILLMIQDQVNGFECQCVPGYHGDQCETEFNECASDPCQNEIRCHVSSIYPVPPIRMHI